MENQLDDLERPLSRSDQRMSDPPVVEAKERLDHQFKPIAQWLMHIDHIFNEVDNTVLALPSPEKDRINQTLYKQLSRLSIEASPPNELLTDQFPRSIGQFQDLVTAAREELCSLKSTLQTDTPAPKAK